MTKVFFKFVIRLIWISMLFSCNYSNELFISPNANSVDFNKKADENISKMDKDDQLVGNSSLKPSAEPTKIGNSTLNGRIGNAKEVFKNLDLKIYAAKFFGNPELTNIELYSEPYVSNVKELVCVPWVTAERLLIGSAIDFIKNNFVETISPRENSIILTNEIISSAIHEIEKDIKNFNIINPKSG